MAGGTFSSMNKVRPGAYINFESESDNIITIGSRGIATMPMALSWGGENTLISLTGSDLVNGTSLAKVGLMPDESATLLINLALQNCNTLKLYNINKNGVKATRTLEDGLVITAKYPGVFGNKIAILIKASESNFTVETYANGYYVESQKVATIEDLQSNDYVEFSGTGTLSATASTLLEGGTDGTIPESSEYLSSYFNLLKSASWNTMALTSTADTDITKASEFVKQMREDEGKYVQVVVANAKAADYEGIINVVNGVVLEDDTNITAAQFTAWVAGATAGADIIDSLSGKVVTNAISINGMLSNDEIIEALNNGKFVLSLNQDGTVKVEKDINSLHTFTSNKNYIFSKNRVIRELDEIGSSIKSIWETTYLGKVSNNDSGRTLFKSSIIDYLTDLQNRGAIQDFDSSQVTVEAGNNIDSVMAAIAIKPVDSMEFLYMTIVVER
jgi:hypothetical protein